MKVWIGIAACALLSLPAAADKAKPAPRPGKGFYKVMAKKGKWVLKDTIGESKATITVEVYDTRKVDGADVARIRWTAEKQPLGESTEMPGQVAVTDKGLYILRGDADDAAVSKALKGKPARSDPPKAYPGTKKNQGRYLTVSDGEVCFGAGPLPGDGDCADVCDGSVCWDADGPTEIMGTLAPDMSIYRR